MARYEHLPIYGVSLDIARQIGHILKGFPKNCRVPLGKSLLDTSIDIVTTINQANASLDKAAHLRELQSHVVRLETLVKVAHDLRLLSNQQLADLGDKIASLGKQASGWLKKFGDRAPESLKTTVARSVHR